MSRIPPACDNSCPDVWSADVKPAIFLFGMLLKFRLPVSILSLHFPWQYYYLRWRQDDGIYRSLLKITTSTRCQLQYCGYFKKIHAEAEGKAKINRKLIPAILMIFKKFCEYPCLKKPTHSYDRESRDAYCSVSLASPKCSPVERHLLDTQRRSDLAFWAPLISWECLQCFNN